MARLSYWSLCIFNQLNKKANGWLLLLLQNIGGPLHDNTFHPLTRSNVIGKLPCFLTRANNNMRKQESIIEPKGLLNGDMIHHKTTTTSKVVMFLLVRVASCLSIFNHTLSMCRITGVTLYANIDLWVRFQKGYDMLI